MISAHQRVAAVDGSFLIGRSLRSRDSPARVLPFSPPGMEEDAKALESSSLPKSSTLFERNFLDKCRKPHYLRDARERPSPAKGPEHSLVPFLSISATYYSSKVMYQLSKVNPLLQWRIRSGSAGDGGHFSCCVHCELHARRRIPSIPFPP